jgi:hypothetical protein
MRIDQHGFTAGGQRSTLPSVTARYRFPYQFAGSCARVDVIRR